MVTSNDSEQMVDVIKCCIGILFMFNNLINIALIAVKIKKNRKMR